MKWIIAIIFGLTATVAYAGTSGYYDWTNGQPAVMIDSTDTTATTTIDWINGQPTAVEQFVSDAVATPPEEGSFQLKGTVKVKAGRVEIKQK